MKKIIFCFILFLYLGQPTLAFTGLNCPFGQIDDPYPGLCVRYIDTDGNNICDNGQSDQGIKTNTTQTPLSQKTTMRYYFFEITIILFLLYGFGKYLIYLGAEGKIEWLKNFNQKRLRYAMNLLLLLSFGVTAITSLVVLAQLQLGWFRNSTINFSWWHIESGLAMVIVSLIHVIERRHFFALKFFK